MMNHIYKPREMKYQSPSLVIFAEGKIFFNAAGTFPANDGSAGTEKTLFFISYIIELRKITLIVFSIQCLWRKYISIVSEDVVVINHVACT